MPFGGASARTFGNGLADLSQEAICNCEEFSAEMLPALTAALYDHGLLSEEGEITRAVIGSPLAGLDPTACIDGRALVRELEVPTPAISMHCPTSFVSSSMKGQSRPRRCRSRRAADRHRGPRFARRSGWQWGFNSLALTDELRAIDAALALARAFLELCGSVSARRMTQLVQAIGAKEIARAAGFAPHVQLPSLPLRVTEAQDVIGIHEHPSASPRLSETVERRSNRSTRVARAQWPSSHALAQHLVPGAKAEALEALEAAGLIVSSEDARFGRNGRLSRPTRLCLGADRYAPRGRDACATRPRLAPKGITMHISGCSKGCASAQSTPGSRSWARRRLRSHLRMAVPMPSPIKAASISRKCPRPLREAQAGKTSLWRRRPTLSSRGAEIYRRSFAIIRAEADLTRFSPEEEKIAVRIIHACGLVEAAADIFSLQAPSPPRKRRCNRCPYPLYSSMVANGITRRRKLPWKIT